MTNMDSWINGNDILKEVNELLGEQTAKGIEKYGHTVDPTEYTTIEWLNHYRQEMIDGLVYATIVIKKLEEMQNEHK